MVDFWRSRGPAIALGKPQPACVAPSLLEVHLQLCNRAFLEIHYIHGERVELSVNRHPRGGWYGRVRAEDAGFLDVLPDRGTAERLAREFLKREFQVHFCTSRCRRYDCVCPTFRLR